MDELLRLACADDPRDFVIVTRTPNGVRVTINEHGRPARLCDLTPSEAGTVATAIRDVSVGSGGGLHWLVRDGGLDRGVLHIGASSAIVIGRADWQRLAGALDLEAK